MEIIRCKNGHSYDPSITPECPECAKMEGKTEPLSEMQQEAYMPTEDIGKTMPLNYNTVPVQQEKPVHWAETQSYQQAGEASQNYDVTMPFYSVEGVDHMTRPVTGWLVCIEGAAKGKDYRLHEEYNYIGRSSKMDVCIKEDATVSRENHAIIAYDTLEKIFYFAPCSGGSIVRVNGKAVLSNTELKAYDKIQIGKSTFMFVPLCGENFVWEES